MGRWALKVLTLAKTEDSRRLGVFRCYILKVLRLCPGSCAASIQPDSFDALDMLLLLLLFFGLRVTCFGLSPAQQQDVLDEVSVIHITTISVKQRIAPPSRFVEEELRLAQRLTRPKTELKSPHPRYRLLSALYAFDSYRNVTATEINRFKGLYDNVPAKHKSIVKKAVKYDGVFTEALDLVERNGQVADAVVNSGLAYYNISRAELDQFVHIVESQGKQPDRISVSQALKSFVRDWALEGELEREQAFACVLDAVNSAFSHRENEVEILVPGSGLNRLGYDIADLSPSFTVTTNEYSAFVNLAYRFLLSSPEPFQHTIHPYIETWSHARTRSEINRAISFPNRPLNPHKVLHVEGDFTRVLTGSPYTGKYDAVATLFFIDTARNLISYFETIHTVLKKGGLWINFGPLLYGSGPWVQLTLDEIVQVIESMGFEFVSQDHRCGSVTLDSLRGKVWGQDVLYNFNSSALLRSGYQGQFWVVRKL